MIGGPTKEFALVLDEPAYVKLTSADGSKSVSVDVYVAMRLLAKAEATGDEAKRWEMVLDFLAENLECQIDDLAENVAIAFNDYVCAVVAALNDARKKKAETVASEVLAIASSPTSTPASPTTSAPGRTKKNKRGSKTSPA
jgi:hypothetical protein